MASLPAASDHGPTRAPGSAQSMDRTSHCRPRALRHSRSMQESSPAAVIVEDDEQMAEVLRFILVREGYSVRLAPDGRTAQQLIDTAPAPALVILDVMLPHVDGCELLARLRGSESWRSVPVIIVSARS